LRGHLKNTKVRVIDIMPPAVQTEPHNEDAQPDLKGGPKIGIPLDYFVSECWDELCKENEFDEYPIGLAKLAYGLIEPGRKEMLKVFPLDSAKVGDDIAGGST